MRNNNGNTPRDEARLTALQGIERALSEACSGRAPSNWTESFVAEYRIQLKRQHQLLCEMWKHEGRLDSGED